MYIGYLFDVRADTSNPIFILTADTINCSQPRAMLKVVSIDSNLNFNWTFPDGTQYFGNPVTALEGGIHFVKVTSQRNYCSGFDSVRVVVDTIHPDVFAVDASLPCNSDSIQLKVSSNCSDPIFIWTGPNRFLPLNKILLQRILEPIMYLLFVRTNALRKQY